MIRSGSIESTLDQLLESLHFSRRRWAEQQRSRRCGRASCTSTPEVFCSTGSESQLALPQKGDAPAGPDGQRSQPCAARQIRTAMRRRRRALPCRRRWRRGASGPRPAAQGADRTGHSDGGRVGSAGDAVRASSRDANPTHAVMFPTTSPSLRVRCNTCRLEESESQTQVRDPS